MGVQSLPHSSVAISTLVSWVNVHFQEPSHSTLQEVVLGKDLEFPDELPTDESREAAANNIISPFGSDANLHHHKYDEWREKRLS